MNLNYILKKAKISNYFTDSLINHKINKIEVNSKEVTENDIFIAIKGSKDDGHNYISEAINNGCKTVIYCSNSINKECNNINYIKVDDTKKTLGILANIFYKNITKKIKLIGVTGTNGKTTISTLLYNFFLYNGLEAMLIGTNGIDVLDNHYDTSNTTPNILQSLSIINEAYKKGIKYVVMEVSSHAIKELRVFNFDFNIAIFSNLTHDHLDYHKTMIDYKYTKGLFIQSINNKRKNFVVLNKDSNVFELYNSIARTNVVTYGIKNDSDYKAINIIKSMDNGTSFKLVFKNEKVNIRTSLIGEFNVSNILAVISTIEKMNFNINDFVRFIRIYVRVSGRMEYIKIKKRTFIIDYAHTPDGVKNVCLNIKEYTNNKLYIIVGCGGNRDKLKRPIIGEIVTNIADYVIFTNDNPRDENEEEIVKDIIKGVSKNNYEIILNREKAIQRAIKLSKENDCIGILGKGSEASQIIKGIKYPFNDLEVVKKLMKKVE